MAVRRRRRQQTAHVHGVEDVRERRRLGIDDVQLAQDQRADVPARRPQPQAGLVRAEGHGPVRAHGDTGHLPRRRVHPGR